MKKIILTLLLSLMVSSPFVFASNSDYMKNMAHSNPVPNYMSIIMANADTLELSSDQKQKVQIWKKKNGKNMAVMVDNVIAGEAEIKSASMSGVSQLDIKTMSEKLMDTRLKIIAGKTSCRDYMMQVLSDAQWIKLTDIIKAG